MPIFDIFLKVSYHTSSIIHHFSQCLPDMKPPPPIELPLMVFEAVSVVELLPLVKV